MWPRLGSCCKFLHCLQIQEDAVTKVVISNNVTDNFPQICVEHERTIEEICLNSTVSSLPPQLFYCQSLRILSVSNNNLEYIPDAIGSLRHLQILNLSRNYLSTLPDSIRSCKNLSHLDLSCNNLQRLPDAITCIVSLQELYLNEAYLEFLPANFGRLINLRILELRLNSLLTLPKSIGRLVNLERIDIGGNDFKELPEVVGELLKLRELWIDFNQIRRISPNIGKLRELQHFEANGNLLENLPNETCYWSNAEVFSICTNNLKNLPYDFGMLTTLVTLKCEFCKLEELPDSICKMELLEEIVVSHNQLNRLPTTIGMLRNLRFLFADDNNLQSLPDEICSCVALSVLSVSRNKLTDLPLNIGHLTKLKVLNLVGNFISSLPVSVLSMVNLSSLWLSENQTQPLVHLQYDESKFKTRLTCFMLPQNQGQMEIRLKETKVANTSAHAIPPRRICFVNEDERFVEDDESPEVNFSSIVSGKEQLESRLTRSPTPYPKKLRLMSKYARSGQKLSQKLPLPPNVKEARIIVNNYTYNDLEKSSTIPDENQYFKAAYKDNQYEDLYNTNRLDMETNFQNEKLLCQKKDFIQEHLKIQHQESNNWDQMSNAELLHLEQTLCNDIYNNEKNVNQEEMPLSNNDKMVLHLYQPHQQFTSPPPYHIARNYTKKTLKDLSNYDSMRNQQHFYDKETQNHCVLPIRDPAYFQEDSSIPLHSGKTKDIFNYDEQNNLLYVTEKEQSGIELIENSSQTAKLSQESISINEQVSFCKYSKPQNLHQFERSSYTTNNSAIYNVKKRTWLFGAHKNPTVKQITLKEESDIPVFHIGEIINEEGIYVIWIAPDSNASRLLVINDKLLQVNGHDFTDISLNEAKQILDNTSSPMNIMLSRK